MVEILKSRLEEVYTDQERLTGNDTENQKKIDELNDLLTQEIIKNEENRHAVECLEVLTHTYLVLFSLIICLVNFFLFQIITSDFLLRMIYLIPSLSDVLFVFFPFNALLLSLPLSFFIYLFLSLPLSLPLSVSLYYPLPLYLFIYLSIYLSRCLSLSHTHTHSFSSLRLSVRVFCRHLTRKQRRYTLLWQIKT